MLVLRLRPVGEDMLTRSNEGFTLIEVTIAILILSTALLGIAASTGRMIEPAATADLEFKALQAVEDRLSHVRLELRYGVLDSLFAGTESNLPGLDECTRLTEVTRYQTTVPGGKILDYTNVVVTVSGGGLATPVSRKLVLGAP